MATHGFFEALFLLQQCVLAMENLALFMVLIGCHQKYVKWLPFFYAYIVTSFCFLPTSTIELAVLWQFHIVKSCALKI